MDKLLKYSQIRNNTFHLSHESTYPPKSTGTFSIFILVVKHSHLLFQGKISAASCSHKCLTQSFLLILIFQPNFPSVPVWRFGNILSIFPARCIKDWYIHLEVCLQPHFPETHPFPLRSFWWMRNLHHFGSFDLLSIGVNKLYRLWSGVFLWRKLSITGSLSCQSEPYDKLRWGVFYFFFFYKWMQLSLLYCYRGGETLTISKRFSKL